MASKELPTRRELRESAPLQRLVAIISHTNPEVQKHNLRLLNVLCVDEKAEEDIRKAGGVDPTVNLVLDPPNRFLFVVFLSSSLSLSLSHTHTHAHNIFVSPVVRLACLRWHLFARWL